MFIPKAGVTPALEFGYFLGHEYFNGLAELFFKEKSTKTHFGEHCFYIV
jgi:hypothetical protein